MPQAAQSKASKSTRAPKASDIFDQEYKRLNPEQQLAVQTIEGPVMVVAGPGTGKTQVVALRVANILKRTQMKPSNILCLTFSTNGAKAMRERLRKIIGPDAYGVTVSTVHSFCNDLIQQHPELFAEFRALEQVSNIERLRIIRDAFKKMGKDSILARNWAGFDRAADVLSRITQMKRDGFSPEDLSEHIATYQEDIKTSDTGRVRDTSTKAYQDDQRKVKQFEEFIEVYEHYNAALAETHRYDFEDMVLVCLKAFKEHDWLLASLQERYMYVLVDEFQDLNGAQNKVIEKLTDYVFTEQKPNVFAVGDDDQAIFRFQGANIGNMKSFLERFGDATVITLTTSYRSTAQILSAASSVISQNEERLTNIFEKVEKNLVANEKTAGDKPQFLRYPDTSLEYGAISEMLKKAHEEGLPWNEMAVLCRRNEEVIAVSDALTAVGIPSEVVAKRDLVTHPQVLQAIALLRAVENPFTSHLLADALSVPSFNCHHADLGRLWLAVRDQSIEKDKPLSLHEYLLEHREKLSKEIQYAHDVIHSLHTQLGSITLPALLQELLIQSHLLPDPADKEVDPRAIAGLHAFYDYIKMRCYEQKSLVLPALISDLDQYITEPGLKLEYDFPHLVMDGVQLMTAHGAKGLEFEYVIIPNVWYGNWGNRSRGASLSLPDYLIYDIDRDVEKRANQEDERRLFYVAMTRAKRRLTLAFPESYRSGEQMRDAQVSSFIAEAGTEVDEKVLPISDLPSPIETMIQPELKIDEAFKAFLEERLKDFELSVTAMNVFLRDPQEFLWEQLLRQPRAKPKYLAFGTAVHFALEQRNAAWKSGNPFTEQDLISTFETYLKHKEVLTDSDRDDLMHMGHKILSRYAEQTSGPPPIVLTAEKTLHALIEETPIKGKVDRIDLFEMNGRECRVLDYKTGVPKKTEDAVRKDEGLFRQLVFYNILCDLDPRFIHDATLFTFDFVGNDKEDRRVIDLKITQEEREELKELIQKVWAKIIALDFTPL